MKDRNYALAIGIGVALFSIHNTWITNLTSVNGKPTLFIPAMGTAIWVLATLFFLRDNYKTLTLGDKKVWIPLLIIAGAIALSGITADSLEGKFAPLFTGVALFSIYIVSRQLGKDIFVPLAIGATIASIGVIISGSIWKGQMTGGLVFERNYDIAIGYIILGAILYRGRFSSILRSVGLVAVFLTGAPEGLFAGVVIILVAIWRRDWGKRLVFEFAPVLIVAVVWFSSGWGQSLYSYTHRIADTAPSDVVEQITPVTQPIITTSPSVVSNVPIVSQPEVPEFAGDNAIGFRLKVISASISNLKPLGEGYNLTEFKRTTVHNVPLIIIQQLGYPGALAALAWLWVTFFCLIKTKWKYALVALLALSVFDHFVFTQMAPVWWIVIGVATASALKTDLVFKNAD